MFAGYLIRMRFHWSLLRPNSVSSCRPGLDTSSYGCLPLLLLFMEESLTNNSDAREQPLLSIVMPVFREGASLSAFVTDVRSALKQSNRPYALDLVDDGSPDDTWKVITTEAKGCQALRGLRLRRNFGKEAPSSAGLEYGQGDALMVIDAAG